MNAKTAQFNTIGERLKDLILAAHPNSGAEVKYDGFAETYHVSVFGREHKVNIAIDSPAAALMDIGKQLLSKRI